MSGFDDDYAQHPIQHGERSAESLRRIVRYQRWLIAVVLGQLVLWIGFIALSFVGADVGLGANIQLPLLVTCVLGVIGGINVFLLALELRSVFVAVIFGLATIIPCLGLFVIVLVNGYATSTLKKHRIPVGLLGANVDDVQERRRPYDFDEDEGW